MLEPSDVEGGHDRLIRDLEMTKEPCLLVLDLSDGSLCLFDTLLLSYARLISFPVFRCLRLRIIFSLLVDDLFEFFCDTFKLRQSIGDIVLPLNEH